MKIDLKEVKKFWKTRAQQHSKNASLTNLEEDQKLVKLKKELEEKKVLEYIGNTKNKRILDLAGGFGYWAFKFAKNAKKVDVVEYCSELIKIGKQKAKEMNLQNINFINCPVQEFNSNCKYDIIFLSGILIYLNDEDLKTLGRELTKYTHNKTKIILRDGTGLNKKFILKNKYSETLKQNYNAIYRTKEEYQNWFKKWNFQLIREENMFEKGCCLNKFPETRLRIYKFEKNKKNLLQDIREGKHIKEGMYTDLLRIPHVTLTYFIVKKLKKTKITPNQVTFFSLILILIASFFFSRGPYINYIWASIFYYLSFVFDTVDGCLAREKNETSPLGGWYDKIADRLANPILFFSITWGIYNSNPSIEIWIWSFIAYAALEFSVIAQYNFRRMFAFGLDVIKKERKKRGMLKEFMLNDFFIAHSIILFALTNLLQYYLIFFSIYGWLFNLAMISVMTLKAKKLIKLNKKD